VVAEPTGISESPGWLPTLAYRVESEELSEENHMAPDTTYKNEENRMSSEDNMGLGRRIVDALNTGNLTAIDEVFAPGYVDRTPNPGTTPDREGFKQGLTKFRAAFPDFRYTIDDEIVVGDKLVHRLTGRGTQKGEFQGVPATGKYASWSEIHIGRIANGKVVEHWGLGYQLGMMQQLGLVASPKVASPK